MTKKAPPDKVRFDVPFAVLKLPHKVCFGHAD